MIYKAPS